MPQFMLYAHSNPASDNIWCDYERKVHQKEGL